MKTGQKTITVLGKYILPSPSKIKKNWSKRDIYLTVLLGKYLLPSPSKMQKN